MPRSTSIEIGVPTGSPQRLSERKTLLQTPAARAVEDFGPRNPVSAEAWPEPEIWQWLMAELPWGHTTRLLARVKGWRLEPGRNQGVLPGRADSGANW